jgi:N-acetylneuraminic acid mutarotase
MVWTGSEALVWGSSDPERECGQANDGAAYHPASDTWRLLATSPKAGGSLLNAVWTGREMIIWGGLYGKGYCIVGEPAQSAAYHPETDGWRALPPAPEEGNVLSAVWTGNEMIVWGNYVDEGYGVPPYTVQGAAYDPAANRWRLIADLPLPDRIGYSTEWTGEELILWGGTSFRHPAYEQLVTDYPLEVAAYDPARDAWRVRAAAPLPSRSWHASVWTGTELIVWGGENESGYLSDGAAYDPVTDTWRPISAAPLGARYDSTSMWTGRWMIVWGGTNNSGDLSDGAAYDPVTDSWRQLAPAPLEGRRGHSAVWTGAEMIIWGGHTLDASVPEFVYFNDGAAYTPSGG